MFIKLKNLLNQILEGGTKTSKPGEMIYYCPFCHHHKKKFCVNLDPKDGKFQQWHCWV